MICAFGLLGFVCERRKEISRTWIAAAVALAVLFLANIFYIAIGRTTLVVIPLLLLLLGFRYFGWKGIVAALVAAVVMASVAWIASPLLRERVTLSFSELRSYEASNAVSSTGIRLEVWKKSLEIVATAPLLGHGTGSIPGQFRSVAVGGGLSGLLSNNPHNQFFAVAIQVGLVGTAILVAMWIAHLMVFRGSGLVAWIGIVVVLQNLAAAPFNAHLFDSFHGWLYAFGFGVIGGMALRQNETAAPP
jgi:O-antigen ligase